jgi:hypothetical protein
VYPRRNGKGIEPFLFKLFSGIFLRTCCSILFVRRVPEEELFELVNKQIYMPGLREALDDMAQEGG